MPANCASNRNARPDRFTDCFLRGSASNLAVRFRFESFEFLFTSRFTGVTSGRLSPHENSPGVSLTPARLLSAPPLPQHLRRSTPPSPPLETAPAPRAPPLRCRGNWHSFAPSTD